MSSFYKVTPQHVIDAYFEAKTIAEDRRGLETQNAIKIQSAWRQFSTRKAFWIMKLAVLDLQRVYRGHLHGRQVLKQMIEDKKIYERELYYHFCATQIQKIYRGWRSRKYKHDFYARKRHLQDVEDAQQRTDEFISELIEEEQQLQEQEAANNQKEAFFRAAENCHHLISTKTIAGVYKPPHATASNTTIYGDPIEDHLRGTARIRHINTLTQLGTVKKTSPADKLDSKYFLAYPQLSKQKTTTIQSPLKETVKLPNIDKRDKMMTKEARLGPFKPQKDLHDTIAKTYDKSVQNSVPYEVHDETMRMEKQIEKEHWVAKDFRYKKPPSQKHERTLRNGEAYSRPISGVGRDGGGSTPTKVFKPTVSNKTTGVFDPHVVPYMPTSTLTNISQYRERSQQ